MRFASRLLLVALSPLLFASACGGDVFTTPDAGDDADSSSGSGGDAATGGSDASTGGGSIADNCGDNIKTECDTSADCVVAVDVCDECYSSSCSLPFAAGKRNTLTQGCLRLWERRDDPPSEKCAPEQTACTGECAVQPECPTAECVDGTCTLKTDDSSCSGSGGTTSTGGASSSGGSASSSGGLTAAGGFIVIDPVTGGSASQL